MIPGRRLSFHLILNVLEVLLFFIRGLLLHISYDFVGLIIDGSI